MLSPDEARVANERGASNRLTMFIERGLETLEPRARSDSEEADEGHAK